MNFNLSSTAWGTVLEHAILVGSGVALTYLVQNLTAQDFGVFGPIVVGLLSVAAAIIQQAINNVPPAPPAS